MSGFPPPRDLPAMAACYALTGLIGWLVFPSFLALLRDIGVIA
jgi:hypothetical protein